MSNIDSAVQEMKALHKAATDLSNNKDTYLSLAKEYLTDTKKYEALLTAYKTFDEKYSRFGNYMLQFTVYHTDFGVLHPTHQSELLSGAVGYHLGGVAGGILAEQNAKLNNAIADAQYRQRLEEHSDKQSSLLSSMIDYKYSLQQSINDVNYHLNMIPDVVKFRDKLKNDIYTKAIKLMGSYNYGDVKKAYDNFNDIIDFKDAKQKREQCKTILTEIEDSVGKQQSIANTVVLISISILTILPFAFLFTHKDFFTHNGSTEDLVALLVVYILILLGLVIGWVVYIASLNRKNEGALVAYNARKKK